MNDYSKTSIYDEVASKMRNCYLVVGGGLVLTFGLMLYFLADTQRLALAYRYFPIIIILELVLGGVLSFGIYKLNATMSSILFFVYSILNGITLTGIASLYSFSVVLNVLIGTAVVFLLLACYGYFTKSDLSGYTNYLLIGLVAIVILSLINMFLRTPMMDIVISSLGVIIFSILIASDSQRIKIILHKQFIKVMQIY